MYKNLLVPTDGSKLSDKAVKEATGLAATLKATVTLYYAVPGYPEPIYAESSMMITYITPQEYRASSAKFAAKVLDRAAAKVAAGGVKVQTYHSESDLPHEGIVAAAKKKRCDLIVMASHGRRGVSGFLLGSETQKVLTHSKIPVLVVR